MERIRSKDSGWTHFPLMFALLVVLLLMFVLLTVVLLTVLGASFLGASFLGAGALAFPLRRIMAALKEAASWRAWRYASRSCVESRERW